MTQKNSLMEWLEQIRRINKSVDIICMDTIDGIIQILPYIRKRVLYDNRDFFNRFCEHYHKDNPIDLLRTAKKSSRVECRTCKILSSFVRGSISRCWEGINMVKIQWMEVVDLFWERPELVNAAIIDDYIRQRVEEVCKEFNKQNPLENGMWEHFGKHWKNKKGEWVVERRQRF